MARFAGLQFLPFVPLLFAVPWSYSRGTLPTPRTSVAVLALALLACSSEAPPVTNSGGAPVSTPTSPNTSACPGDQAANTQCVTLVHGQIVDGANQPVTAPVSVCGGALLCTGTAASEGLFQVTVNRYVDLSAFVLHVYGHPHHGDLITRLSPTATSDVSLNGLPRVPRYESKGDILAPTNAVLTVARSGPVELTLAAGSTTAVEPAHENTRELLVGAVPDATRWDPNIVALYAIGPFDARFTPAASVAITLPASPVIPDGTILDLVALGDDLLDGRTAGTLLKVGSATVTKGVARSDAGSGLGRLTWVGVRIPKGG